MATTNYFESRLLAALAQQAPRYRRRPELLVPEYSPETLQPTGSERTIPVFTPAEPTQQWEVNPPAVEPQAIGQQAETEPAQATQPTQLFELLGAPQSTQPVVEQPETEPAQTQPLPPIDPAKVKWLKPIDPSKVKWTALPPPKYEGMLAGPPGWEQPARSPEELAARTAQARARIGLPETAPGPATTLGELPGTVAEQAQAMGFDRAALMRPLTTLRKGVAAALSQAGLISPQEYEQVWWQLEEPPRIANLPKAETTAGQLASGVADAAVDFVNAFIDPDALALIGLGGVKGPIQKVVLGTFAAEMASAAPSQLMAATAAAKQGDWQEAVRQATGGVGGTLLSAHLTSRLVTPEAQIRVAPAPGRVLAEQLERARPEFPETIEEAAQRGGEPLAVPAGPIPADKVRWLPARSGLAPVEARLAPEPAILPPATATPPGQTELQAPRTRGMAGAPATAEPFIEPRPTELDYGLGGEMPREPGAWPEPAQQPREEVIPDALQGKERQETVTPPAPVPATPPAPIQPEGRYGVAILDTDGNLSVRGFEDKSAAEWVYSQARATGAKKLAYFDVRRTGGLDKARKLLEERWNVRPAEANLVEGPVPEAKPKGPPIQLVGASKIAEEARNWQPPVTDKSGLEADREQVAAAQAEVKNLQAEAYRIDSKRREFEKRVTYQVGRYRKGHIKANAKKADIDAWNALKADYAKIDNAIAAINERMAPARKRLRAAEFQAKAQDTKQPEIVRTAAMVAAYDELGLEYPEGLLQSLSALEQAELQRRFPDMTPNEFSKLQGYLASELRAGRTIEDAFRLNPGLQLDAMRRRQLVEAVQQATAGGGYGELPEDLAKTLDEVAPGWKYGYGGTRKARALSATEVADLSRRTVEAVETGRRNLAEAEARRVAEEEAQKARFAEEDAKVRQMMAEAAAAMDKQGTRRGVKAVKDELVQKLKEAVKNAPETLGENGAARRILIAVPGDGIFALTNRKMELAGVLKKAEKLSTSTAAPKPADWTKPSTINIPGLGKLRTVPDMLKSIKELFTSEDETRAVLTDVYADGRRALATDGRVLVEVKGPFPENKPEAFPIEPVDKLWPTAAELKQPGLSVSTEELYRIARMAKRMTWGDKKLPEVDLWTDKEGRLYAETVDEAGDMAAWGKETRARFLGKLNPDNLENVARFARNMGDERVTLRKIDRTAEEGAEEQRMIHVEGTNWRAMMTRFSGKFEAPAEAQVRLEQGHSNAFRIGQLKRQLAEQQKKLDKNVAKMGTMVPPPIVAEITRKISDRMAKIQDEIDRLERPGKSTSAASPGYAATGGGELGPAPATGPQPPPADNPAFSAFDAVPLEMPEAVSIVRALLGAPPKVLQRLRALGGRALGVFQFTEGEGGRGKIGLRADIFELLTNAEKADLYAQAEEWARANLDPGENYERLVKDRFEFLAREASMAARSRNPIQAMKTIWHEIGHLVDWLPDRFLRGRGNIFGHIATLKNYLKRVLPLDPTKPAGEAIKAEEREALRKQAQEQMRIELGPIEEIVEKIFVEEPELRIVGITAADVKNLLGMDAREKMPELYLWFATQSDAVKAEVLRKAMRGVLDERLAALGRTERVGTRIVERTVRRKVGREPTPEEIEERFKRLFRAELEKRNLAEYKALKSELEPLIAWWRGTEKMEDYFKDPAEMYAEAFSVLLNNPAALAQRAPTFARLFFNYLERKPEVAEAYNRFQELVKGGGAIAERDRLLVESWNADNERSMARLKRRFKQSARDFLDNITYHIDRRMGPIYRMAKGSPREGRVIGALGNYLYRGAEHERFLGTMNREVGQRLVRANLDWNDLGQYLFHQRISMEPRSMNLANPRGTTPKNSLEWMRWKADQLGPQRWVALETAAKAFRKVYETIVLPHLREARMFSEETQKLIDENVWYATFHALREGRADTGIEALLDASFGTGIGPRIYRRIGNLGDIKQPATATVLKGLSLISAAHRNIAKRETVELLLQRSRQPSPMPGAEIKPADRRWTGRRWEFVLRDTPQVGTIVYMEDGKPKAYYVRKVVADALEYGNPLENRLYAGLLSGVNWLKAGFTQLNYGFWPVNFVRDSGTFWLNMPGLMAPVGWARALPKAIAAARASVRGRKQNPAADAFLARRMAISRADPRGVWSSVDNEYDLNLASFGLDPAQWRKEGEKVNWLARAWNAYRETGQIFERVNKIAGMIYLDRAYPDMPEWKKAQIVRERAGSPNFLERGASNAAVDLFAMFYNPWKEAIRSTVRAARENPWTFGAKVSGLIIAPSLIQSAAVLGLLGPQVKQMYASMPDYDLANYLNIPLGWSDEDHERILYLRLPLPEPARIAHGLLTQAVTRRGEGVASYMGGQVPSPNAMLGVGAAWANWMLFGHNPYDSFRGQQILTDTQAEAGGWPATKELGKWTWNELGGALFHRFQNIQLDTPPVNDVQKFLTLPGVNNFLGRWIKVSDRGLVDANRRETEELRRTRAMIRLGVQEVIRKMFDNEPFTDAEKILMREPYAMQYLMDSIVDVTVGRASGALHRINSAKSREEKAMIIRRELDRLAVQPGEK